MVGSDNDEPLTEIELNWLIELDRTLRSGETVADSCNLNDDADNELAKIRRLLLNLQSLYCAQEATHPDWWHADLPARIGRYDIERLLGSGGFAVVYLANDRYLNRRAAIKVPRPHALASPELRQRFVREAQAAAQLEHQHVIATYEAGEDGGVPYIAYAYCEGPTLAAWIQQQTDPMPPRVAAALLSSLAEAVHFGHQRGILHRDIKPANVLLQPQSEAGEEFPFVAKLADFGLAKLIEADLRDTASSVMLGTPRYMAPEQATTRGAEVGPSTDVYGLGAVLYEVLTRQPPFTAETAWDALMQVREYLPAAPCLIRPQIPRELEVITLTCLAKDPADRYATAADLAADLGRYLNGKAIRARPASLTRQLWLWCRRRRTTAALSATVIIAVVLLIASLVVHSVQTKHLGDELADRNRNLTRTVQQLDAALVQGRQSQHLAESRMRELSQTLYAIEVSRAAGAWLRGDVKTMAAALEPFSRPAAGEDDLREFGWRYLWCQQSVRERFRTILPGPQYAACFAPDGQKIAFAGADSVVRIYKVGTYELIHEIHTDQTEINGIVFGPDGDWLATAGDDGTVSLWTLPSGERRALWPVFKGHHAFQLGYSKPLGLLIVCGNTSDVYLFHVATGQQYAVLTGGHTAALDSLAVSPDGRRLLTCGLNYHAVVWNLATQEVQHRLEGFEERLSAGAWSADSRHVAISALNGELRIFDADSGDEVARRKLLDAAQSLAYTAEGLLVVGDRGGAVSVFQTSSTTMGVSKSDVVPLTQWAPHKHRIYGLAISADGSLFATASRDQEVAVFEQQITPRVQRRQFVTPIDRYAGRRTVGPDRQGREYRIFPKGIAVITAVPDANPMVLRPDLEFRDLHWDGNRLLAVAGGSLYCWDTSAGLNPPRVFELDASSTIFKFAPLDRYRVLLLLGTKVTLFNLQTERIDQEWDGRHALAVSPDRRSFAVACNSGHRLTLHDAVTLRELWSSAGHTGPLACIAFDSAGRHLYSCSSDRTIRIWDAGTGREQEQLRGHESSVSLVSVSPDNRTLASCDESGSLRLWDLRSGRELFELFNHDRPFSRLDFTADGHGLCGVDHELVEFRWSSCAGRR